MGNRLYAVVGAVMITLLMFGASIPADVSGQEASLPGTFNVEAFQTDPFTGASTFQIPIVTPLAAGGVTPKIVVRYNSGTVDELAPTSQGQPTGLGWTLDNGGFILRDLKGTTTTTDDTFKLAFGGMAYDLILIDSAQSIYHTKDETFSKVQYFGTGDYWVLTTKDGTQHRFGYNTDSKAITRGYDFTTAITYRYMLDRVTTTSGVAILYAYTKQGGTIASNGQTYDQAIYPSAITYAYSGSSLIGPAREVLFTYAPRSDWTDTSASTVMSFHETSRLDTIEVRAAGSLVCKYVFGFDYSVDRNPNHTWGGGATGDLTLRTVTTVGADGVSTLPALSFSYTDARLSSASNGIGGTVSYTYQRFMTSPLYSVRTGWYDSDGNYNCGDFRPSASVLDPYCPADFVGYIFTSPGPGTVPLYSAKVGWYDSDFNYNCGDFRPSTTIVDPLCGAQLVGHVYVAKVDRYRVITRSVSDGRGGTSTLTFSYTGLGLSSDGTEFRGHASVRATDPLGHYTDTWFKQDDLLKGRPYHSQTRRSSGALLAETTHIWATSTPYPGVTFVKLAQTDTAACDDNGASCRTASLNFEYDTYGNQARAYQWGDVAITGDERDESVDWVVDATNWIHRPKRIALYSATGALLRERWFSYDGLGWGSLGTRGLLTREERRLVGGVGTAGNPVATAGYDAYGNRTSIADPRGCAATIVFESVGRAYPATVTTCLGHVMSFAYDARWGQKTSESDPNSQTTTYTYDAFGRLTKATGPLDTGSLYGSMSRVYENLGNPSAQRIVTYRTTVHGTASAIWSDEYFDGLGRTYLRRSQGPGSQIIQSETTFDTRGLKATESAPHFSTESAVATQFTYDARGRQTQATYPDGTTFKTAYAPDGITLTDQRNNVTRRFLDIYGRVIRVEEVNGAETYATTYAYDAASALVGITNQLSHNTTLTYDLLGRRTTIGDPNTGTTTTTYEPGGAVLSQTDARNQTVTFTYDQLGRALTKTFPGAQVTWTYDDPTVAYSKGRVTKVADATSVTTFAYNQIGRPTQVQRLFDGTTYTMSRSYNALGRVLSQTFPDGDGVTYTYNEAGWLASIPGYIGEITYDARGQRTQIQYANGVTTTLVYHPTNFRLTSRSTTGPGGSQQNLTYDYDPVGNVTQILDGLWTGGRTFTYDALNRVTSASGPFGPGQSSVTQSYTYNAIGNIVGKAGVDYTYTDALHPSAVTSRSDGPSYTYDASGNALTSAGRTLAWDAENRLLSVTQGATTAFAYDPDGIRIRKTTSGSVTHYPFPGYEVDPNGGITKYVGGVAKKSTGAMLFYHHDHLGGLNAVTDASGARVQLDEYEPWGQVSRAEGNADPSHRFTGKELDPETGLYYYGGRYYDAALGRFVSADPVVPAAGNPQSLNRYSYVINNPANLIDPTGHFFSKILKAIQKWAKGNKGLSIALGITLVGLPGPELNAVGIAMLTATPEGKLALAAGIIAGTAVATFYCGGCGGIATAALVGELIGLYSAVSSGGDVLTGVVVGGAAGALTGYVGGYLGGLAAEPGASIWLKVGSWAVQGAGQGIASGYAGGRGTWQSIAISAALGAATSVVLNSAYYGLAHYEPTFAPGGDPQTTGPEDFPERTKLNIFGTPQDPANPGALDAGGPPSRVLNLLLGANSGAGPHDGLMTYLIRAGLPTKGIAFWLVELPTIPPIVFGVGYGALLPGMTTQPMMESIDR